MPGYCGHCGTALREGAGFCAQCGAVVSPSPAAQPYQAAPPPAAAAAAKGSNTVLKVVLAVFGVFALLAILAAAGLVYTGYRVKQTIEQKAAENGIDLGAFTRGEQGRDYEPCSLLTTAEASEILGVTVERSESEGSTCNYFIQPPSDEEKSNAVAEAFGALERQGESPAGDSAAAAEQPSPELARRSGIEQLTKAFTNAAVDANTPYFTIEVSPDGNVMMSAVKIALGASGVSGVSEKLEGIGDQALMGPLDSLMVFTKNGTGVQIDLRLVGKGRERGIAMAQRIVARM